jgi:hypothetical protein
LYRKKRANYFFSFSISSTLPSNQLSNIPWRRLGVTYTNNEAYFDVIEEIDAIIDRNGAIVMSEIQGYVSRDKTKRRFRLHRIFISRLLFTKMI